MENDNTTDSKIIMIKLVDGTQINGTVNISKGPQGYDRLSDLIGSSNEEILVLIISKMNYSEFRIKYDLLITIVGRFLITLSIFNAADPAQCRNNVTGGHLSSRFCSQKPISFALFGKSF